MGRPAPGFPGELMFDDWEKRVDNYVSNCPSAERQTTTTY